MNVKTIIASNPEFQRETPESTPYLNVSEFFYDTIQGEGINLGQPAAFLRLQGCTQNCVWCDSKEVWRFGNPYTINELFELMEQTDLIEQLEKGQHLVLTGGSPLRQQDNVLKFIEAFIDKYDFLPYIEIENESVLMPKPELTNYVSCWNNSPKLKSSGNPDKSRYRPEVLEFLSSLSNSWFKFVTSKEEDWQEIKRDFIDTGLIRKEQIILMPLGATREELFANREYVVDLSIREGVRYCTREHVVLWDKKTGV